LCAAPVVRGPQPYHPPRRFAEGSRCLAFR
jgi:hypothetical protein